MLWWRRYEKMDVIWHYFQFQYLQAFLFGYDVQYIFKMVCDLSHKDRMPYIWVSRLDDSLCYTCYAL